MDIVWQAIGLFIAAAGTSALTATLMWWRRWLNPALSDLRTEIASLNDRLDDHAGRQRGKDGSRGDHMKGRPENG
ncbi:hypothetical protein [Spongiactinospora sp. 9N601]|uniref:hypothetical protein n=1 Tax=Spongiactinospora sp. 9N601 TaxID=3375149 RepID=UPI003793E21B